MIYREYEFSLNGSNKIERSKYAKGMPVVYVIYNEKEIYIGQTTKLYARVKKHLKDKQKNHLKNMLMITDQTFNDSVILDIEAQLIKYMKCDGRFKVINDREGREDHYYYKKEEYEFIIEPIWTKLYNKGLANHKIQKIRNMNTFKLSPYTVLLEEQYKVEKNIINKDLKKHNQIAISGKGGTGKTVLAIHLFNKLLEQENELKMGFVVPMRTFRYTVKEVFSKTDGLNANMVIAPNQLTKNDKFDILIVDEAHRLRRHKNLASGSEYTKFKNISKSLGLDYEMCSELDWIEKCSSKQILFYDYKQRVKPTDILKKDLEKHLEKSKKYELVSQLRCQGGNDYIEFILDLLHCNVKDNHIKSFGNYDLKVFNSMKEMKYELSKKEKIYGLCRRVSGICFKWDKKKNQKFNVETTKEMWNTKTEDWINSKNASKELGCIHTIQGYDLNYCGVILGKEIDYDKENNKIIIDKNEYTDMNGKKGEQYEELKESIIDIYYTMLTRGIRGTYIYVMNDNLRDYIKTYIETFKKNK